MPGLRNTGDSDCGRRSVPAGPAVGAPVHRGRRVRYGRCVAGAGRPRLRLDLLVELSGQRRDPARRPRRNGRRIPLPGGKQPGGDRDRSGRGKDRSGGYDLRSDPASPTSTGSGVQNLYTGESQASGVAIDPATGKIYWADAISGSGAIRVGNLNGSGTAQNLFSNESYPVDRDADRIGLVAEQILGGATAV